MVRKDNKFPLPFLSGQEKKGGLPFPAHSLPFSSHKLHRQMHNRVSTCPHIALPLEKIPTNAFLVPLCSFLLFFFNLMLLFLVLFGLLPISPPPRTLASLSRSSLCLSPFYFPGSPSHTSPSLLCFSLYFLRFLYLHLFSILASSSFL